MAKKTPAPKLTGDFDHSRLQAAHQKTLESALRSGASQNLVGTNSKLHTDAVRSK